ncbi:hypothetical protein AYK25_08575 [Thermoplasmatales archaeon SM1-50]|nr:MAG: hypothetical protein AYK25_08575 [Thermoplasmatales archaeon SM1-50]
MKQKNQTLNQWTTQDERGDVSRILEWWAIEAFFTSMEDKKRWSLKVAFSEGFVDEKHRGVVCNITLFDQDTNTQYTSYIRTPGARLQSSSKTFDVHHGDSYMKGSYPNYQMHFHDPDHDIEIDFTSHADSFPHWVAQDITHGWLPMGIGFYRYGFIPKTLISGTMKIKGESFTIQGDGFFEHVWGSFDYEHPLTTVSGFLKTIWVYKKLGFWWLQNHTLRIPRRVMLSTENNPLGYDWVWGLFDNGWTVFYGNAMFWFMDGPAAGILIFTKDGKHYTEFSDITFHYNKIIYAKNHDFYYPRELQLIAKKGNETLRLTCSMTNDSREYVRSVRADKFYTGLAICEAPGVIKGSYDDGTQTIPIQGICKIEPQRELSLLGHNVITIDLLIPPRGVGLSVTLESHFFRKNIVAHLQLAPRPRLKIQMQRIASSEIH